MAMAVRSGMPDFRKLRVWRSAHALVINTHQATRKIRGAEFVSLRSQMIRAAMSIAANIVEGRAQPTDREFCRFLRYALASARELEYHLTVAHDVEAIVEATFRSLSNQTADVLRMLHGLIAKLEGRRPVTPSGGS